MCNLCKVLVFLFVSVSIYGCAYTEKIKSHLIPESEYNDTVIKADDAMREGNWAKAAMLFDLASEIKPGNLQLLLKEAEAYRKLGSQSNAIKAYKKIQEFNTEIEEFKESNDRAKEEASLYLLRFSNKNQLNSTLSPAEKIKLDDSQVKLDKATESINIQDDYSKPVQLNDSQVIVGSEGIQSKGFKASSPVVDQQHLNANIEKIIYDWAKAWKVKDTAGYFSHYSDEYNGGLINHSQWMKDRASKIKNARVLDVRVKNISINMISNSQVDVSFYQNFSSDAYRDEGEKRLKFNLINGKWLITSEIFIKKL